jgi:hypothetical protein
VVVDTSWSVRVYISDDSTTISKNDQQYQCLPLAKSSDEGLYRIHNQMGNSDGQKDSEGDGLTAKLLRLHQREKMPEL